MHNRKYLKEYRRELRSNLTLAEAELWKHLKNGQVHNHTIAEHFDNERDNTLKELGIKVLRFENKDVFGNLSAILQEISSNFSK